MNSIITRTTGRTTRLTASGTARRLAAAATLALALALAVCTGAFAMQGMEGQGSQQQGMDMGKGQDMGGMDMKGGDTMGTFTHTAEADGYKAEFQIMSLASMHMKAEDGKTHHVMVKFFKPDGTQLTKVEAKIKVVAPSGKDQVETLKDYSGTYAAAFDLSAKGKYGIICLFKADGGKHMVKFWYPEQ
ncbi:hypothetical protein dsx2_0362 [Desulfovibrio sp. X2]|uniref:hypothetical protein n=1 Tax=Desulfovibrio sp. X2 TaxID=941449 RepID=UPI000358A604|nr:hypothetical protein [Desulfovibrio sp. X2]EPR39788.1 hypothetical protein dsx2_0362 [Desulfovibrio sp. X2]